MCGKELHSQSPGGMGLCERLLDKGSVDGEGDCGQNMKGW